MFFHPTWRIMNAIVEGGAAYGTLRNLLASTALQGFRTVWWWLPRRRSHNKASLPTPARLKADVSTEETDDEME